LISSNIFRLITTSFHICCSPFGRACINEVVSQQVGQANVNGTKLKGFTIPLPPLAEQKRIVAKIEELFSELEAGEESLRVARRQLGVYRQSLLKQAFEGKLTAKWRTQKPAKLESPASLLTRIQSARQSRAEATRSKVTSLTPFPADELVGDFTLPAGWLVLAYGDLCSVVRNGISQKPSGDTGHKIARISAVRPMVFDYDDYRFIDCDDETAADYALVNGDLIFTRYNGARRYVGVCAQFKGREPRLYPDKLIRTRPDLPLLDPRYLEIALNCGLSRAWLETKIRTTAGQSGVSGGDVKAMPVPLCSLPEQHEIVRLLDEQFEGIERNEREIGGALRQSAALRQAILKKAFTGRLVPQDPADEPASTLLARLRAERTIGGKSGGRGRARSAAL
jgi:type I restriction enzyme S subunit